MTATGYHQGEYAGPNTVRALDYNGHEVIGVVISDTAADGTCFFATFDSHMLVSIAPVIASSIRSYDPPEPPLPPEIEPEDYAATRRSLEQMLERMLGSYPDQLRACAIAMSELADVIDAQVRLERGRATCTEEVSSARRAADDSATQSGEGNTFTAAVGSASLADRKTEVQP